MKSRDSYIWFDHEYAAALSGGAPRQSLYLPSAVLPHFRSCWNPRDDCGVHFAGSVAGNVITLNGVACQTLAASTTQLNTAVPNTGTTGQFTVTTAARGCHQHATSFTVTVPDTGGGSGGGTGGGAGRRPIPTPASIQVPHKGLSGTTFVAMAHH